MLCVLKPFSPSVYVLLSYIFMNSRQIPFARAVPSAPPSRWHLRRSCPPPPFFPLLFPCLSLLVPVTDLDPECRLNSHKIGLTLRGPCIVIYSYNKSQRDALFLKFILVKNSKNVSDSKSVRNM
jgi:hypothetical protein